MIFEALKIRSYTIIIANYGIFYGIYLAIGALLDPILSQYNYPAWVTSAIGVTFILSGLISIFIFGMILDKCHKFLLSLRIVAIGGTLAGALAMLIFPLG